MHFLSLALLMVGLAVSCTARLEKVTDCEPGFSGKELTLTATAEGQDTKTTLSGGGASVLWTPGDAISLFYGSGTGGGSQFTSTATEPSAVTNFTGTISVITGGAEISQEDTYFWGLYPYSPTASCDGSTVTMMLSAEQVAMPGTFAPGASPSIGRSRGLSMGFYNIGGGVKFSVTHEGVRKATLRNNDGTPIAGTARIAINESGAPTVQEILSGTDEITLTAPEGEYFEVGEFYYIMIFPTTFSAGFTLTLETYTEEATIVKNSNIKIGRAYFGRMTDVDKNATYTTKTGNIPIPDANFKAYMVEHFDTNGDSEISYEEALAITEINVNTDNIATVSGVEYCKNLTSLVCSYGLLTSLDVSNNKALETLWCGSNQLTNLDVSNNTKLKFLQCHNNQLTSLDISSNIALEDLRCYSNQLTSLDVSNNTALRQLECYSNQLTSLDVSNNTALRRLYCSSNQLTYLDISTNIALEFLHCGNNQLTSLDVSKNIALEQLWCMLNQLNSLDISNNSALTVLNCFYNQLSSLDVSKNTALYSLHCEYNQLITLDVSNNTALNELVCSPMDNNLLEALYIAEGQSIPHITQDRSSDYIPEGTTILVKPGSGGNEGYGEGDI